MMIISQRNDQTAGIVFLLVPEFSMLAFTCALEPLRAANDLAGKELYSWATCAVSRDPVVASNGIEITPDLTLPEALGADAVFVCAGSGVQRNTDPRMIAWLKAAGRRNTVLGGICTGTYLLARAGVIGDRRTTIHWDNMASTREQFPQLEISPALFEIDGDRYTAADGLASLDMMLNEVRNAHGTELATAIRDRIMYDRIRDSDEQQRVAITQRIGTSQPRLLEIISLMEANIEEPLSLAELACHCGVSRRQLERLFRRYLHCVPRRYYLEMRLQRARQLLLQTNIPVLEVAMTCGFISAQHFSKCYRETFGLPPSHERH